VKAPINAGYLCNVASLNIAISSFYSDEVTPCTCFAYCA
jgi:hypothetical protein